MGVITYQDNSKINYDEWLLLRNRTIGASEIGPIVYGSKWTSNLEIFYNKVTGSRKNIENIRTYLGKKTENINREMYCYYDDSNESIYLNESRKTPVKQVINKNVTIFNSDYPHISVTPDGDIQPVLKYEGMGVGSLELKNSQRMVLESYEGKIPTDNIFQVAAQMMIPVRKYADLFFFLDNRNFEEHHFVRKDMKKIEETILMHTIPFWKNVLLARPLYNQLFEARSNYNMKLAGELEMEISQLEPPPQNSLGYLSFLTERYKDRISEGKILTGTNEQLLLAQKYKQLGKQIEKLEKQQQHIEIQIKEFMKENTCLDFGKYGRVTWHPNKNGNRIFNIKNIK